MNKRPSRLDSDSDMRWDDWGHRESVRSIDVFDIDGKVVPSPILNPDGNPARYFQVGMLPIGFVTFGTENE